MTGLATHRRFTCLILGLCSLLVAQSVARAGDSPAVCPAEVVGSLGGTPSDVAIVGDLAYVASSFGGLSIIDIADVTEPRLLSTLSVNARARRVVVVGSLALLGCDYLGLVLVDVSDPVTPTLIGNVLMPGGQEALAVAHHDGYAFVCTGNFDHPLAVVDVSVPEAAAIVTTLDFSGTPRDIAYRDGYLYASVSNWATYIIDASTPTSPSVVGGFGASDDSQNWSKSEVEIDGDLLYHAYYGSSNGLVECFSLADPEDPAILSSLRIPGVTPRRLSIDGDRAYVSLQSAGYAVVDISDADAIALLANAPMPGSVSVCGVDGAVAFVGDSSLGLRLLDVSAPASPAELSVVEFPIQTLDVALVGDRAYLADGFAGLRVVDIADPSHPRLLRTLSVNAESVSVSVVGAFAFLSCDPSELVVIDVSVPTAPVEIGRLALGGTAGGMTIDQSRSLAYVAGGTAGLHIVDISSPSAPSLVSTFDTSGVTMSATHDERFVYIADGSGGFHILDTSDPAACSIVGSRNPGGAAVDVAVVGTTAVLAAQNSIALLDLSNPTFPTVFSYLSMYAEFFGSVSTGVTITNNQTFYVADGYAGVYGFDISDPKTPELIYFSDTPDMASSLMLRDGLVYVADGSSGLVIIDPLPCGAFDLNASGVVNATDLAILLAAWGEGESPADFDGDGIVGASDLAQLLAAWGL